MPKAAVVTLGCKLNQVDSEAIIESFMRAGYEIVPFTEPADVYVVNSCTVTGKTDHQTRQLLRRAIRRKESSPGTIVVATGCYAQTAPRGLVEMVDGLDLVVGNLDKERIPELIADIATAPEIIVRDVFSERDFRTVPIDNFSKLTRAFLRVQGGCNHRCAYCIVPFGRGYERSAPLQTAIQQARRFAENGYREVVITGIHIGRYGKGLDPESSLAELIKEIHRIDGIKRIRLSSIDPKEFSGDLFDALNTIRDKLCPHFHISLQSGDDSILKSMRRDYTIEEYSAVVEKLRSLFPDVCIGNDLIVGFPGETDENFQATLEFLRKSRPAYFHVFRYSPRTGTAAADFPDQVHEDVKRARSMKLHELRTELSVEFRTGFLNRELEVMLESRRCKKTGMLTGLSGNYIRIDAQGPDEWMDRIVKAVPVSLTRNGMLAGRIEVVE